MKSILQRAAGNSTLLDNVRDLTIVVVGILVALWAEGEWQKRQEIALVNHALAQIARGLEHDIEDISGNLNRARLGYEAAEWFQANRQAETDNTQDLRDAIRNLGNCSVLNLDSSAYIMLKNSGSLRLIENKELLQQISSVYESRTYFVAVHKADCENSIDVFALLAPYIKSTIDPTSQSIIPLIEDVPNPQGLFEDQVLVNHIMALGTVRIMVINVVEPHLNHTKKLRDAILIELSD